MTEEEAAALTSLKWGHWQRLLDAAEQNGHATRSNYFEVETLQSLGLLAGILWSCSACGAITDEDEAICCDCGTPNPDAEQPQLTAP